MELEIIELRKEVELQTSILKDLLNEFKEYNKHYIQANPTSEDISNVRDALRQVMEREIKKEQEKIEEEVI